MGFNNLACLFVDQGISTALLIHHDLALLQVVHVLVDVTLCHDSLAMEHRPCPIHLVLAASLHTLLIVA
jgi:hypothetical protein